MRRPRRLHRARRLAVPAAVRGANAGGQLPAVSRRRVGGWRLLRVCGGRARSGRCHCAAGGTCQRLRCRRCPSSRVRCCGGRLAPLRPGCGGAVNGGPSSSRSSGTPVPAPAGGRARGRHATRRCVPPTAGCAGARRRRGRAVLPRVATSALPGWPRPDSRHRPGSHARASAARTAGGKGCRPGRVAGARPCSSCGVGRRGVAQPKLAPASPGLWTQAATARGASAAAFEARRPPPSSGGPAVGRRSGPERHWRHVSAARKDR